MESEWSRGSLVVTGDPEMGHTWFYIPVPENSWEGGVGIDGGGRAGAPFLQGSREGGEQGLGVLFLACGRSSSCGLGAGPGHPGEWI